MRLTYRQFRALLAARYQGSAALAFDNPKRTLISLVRRGYIEPSAPWRLTREGNDAIDIATGNKSALTTAEGKDVS